MYKYFQYGFILACMLVYQMVLHAQKKQKLYDPTADAQAAIDAALIEAKTSNKHVLLQIGGNWCGWCIRFHDFVQTDLELDSLIKANYVQVHVNYSHENENLPLMTKLEYPQRFGFPVFVVLDQAGKRIHTQNSAYLEKGSSYDKRKIKEFFVHWSIEAINPRE